jgi:site-specific recombinase XerD
VSPFLINVLGELRRKSPKATPESFLFPEYAAIYNADDAAPLSSAFRDILVAAGLSEKYQRTNQGAGRSCRRAVSPLSFHSLRHNFVTMLKERGASQMVARELVGHNSDAVNQLYTHTSPELVRKSLKRLPEVFTKQPKAAK